MSYKEKSPWVIHFDGAGCSGCGLEVQACFAPFHDVEQYGISKTNNPRHADVLVITGIINEDNRERVVRIYEQMLAPKAVVAVGVCACTGGIFSECEGIVGGADNLIPVDVYVPGCAARPEVIAEGIMKCFEKHEVTSAEEKEKEEEEEKKEEQDEQ